MRDEDKLLANRLSELSQRCMQRRQWTYSEFLSLSQQDVALGLDLSAPMSLYGGFDGSERRIAVFGSTELLGYEEEPPVDCVLIQPVNEKFADKLTHRDFLGSLMALGLRREMLGDIAVDGKKAYLFCLDSVSDFICRELSAVRHTTVKCSVTNMPEIFLKEPEQSSVLTASQRLDGILAAVFGLSRSESQELIKGEKVFISGRLARSSSAQLKQGDIVSLRGTGRFKYEGIERETKKGKLRVIVRKY